MRPLTRGVRRGALVVVCAIAAGLGARGAYAQPALPAPSTTQATPVAGRPTFNVTPTLLAMRWGEQSTSLLLRNESAETLRFQITAFRWTNSDAGDMRLDATEDVVLFPSLFTIAPGQTRRVRLACHMRPTDRELAYRVIVEQLPSRAGSRSDGGVQMLTRLNLPLFIQPASRVATTTLDAVGIADGALSFDVRNTGTVNTRVRDVLVQGHTRDGRVVHEQRLNGWYVLPGETRHYRLPLAPDVCRGLATVTVTAAFVQTEIPPLQERAPVDPAACRTP